MSLSQYDRDLLKRCLDKTKGAWEDFADRFSGLVVGVIQHTAKSRDIRLNQADIDDLVAEVFMQIVSSDYAILRKFRGECSLATYLTVVARRVIVRQLLKQQYYRQQERDLTLLADESAEIETKPAESLDREELQRMMDVLGENERLAVQMFHLDGKSYEEINQETGIPLNTIGPLLSRARQKLKAARTNHVSG